MTTKMSDIFRLRTVVVALLTASAIVTSQSFSRYSPRSQGKSIRGKYADFGFNLTLDACVELANTAKGNAFNYNREHCWVKVVNLSGDLVKQLTQAYGGWDVYVRQPESNRRPNNGRRGRKRNGKRIGRSFESDRKH